jgi:hypothetical protein
MKFKSAETQAKPNKAIVKEEGRKVNAGVFLPCEGEVPKAEGSDPLGPCAWVPSQAHHLSRERKMRTIPQKGIILP